MKIHPIIWWLIALAVLGGGGVVVYSKIRGIRNNNPGNLERTSDQWKGMREIQDDDRFVQFVDVKWGIRALGQTLTNYFRRHQLNTVEGIISRWAPSSENNTQSYIDAVARRLDIAAWRPFDVEARLPELVRAIIRHENGIQPYSDLTISEGLSLMFK